MAYCLYRAVATRSITFDNLSKPILWPTAWSPDTLPFIIRWNLHSITVMTSPWLVNYLVGLTRVCSTQLVLILSPCKLRAFLANGWAVRLSKNVLIRRAWYNYRFTFCFAYRNFKARSALVAWLSCIIDLLIWVTFDKIARFGDLIWNSNGWARFTGTTVKYNLVGSTRHFSK